MTSNHGSQYSTRICTLRTAIKFIVAMVLSLVGISTHLLSIIITDHKDARNKISELRTTDSLIEARKQRSPKKRVIQNGYKKSDDPVENSKNIEDDQLRSKIILNNGIEQDEEKEVEIQSNSFDQKESKQAASSPIDDPSTHDDTEKKINDTALPTEIGSKNIEQKVGKRVPPLPMSETPALNGAKKGTIECEVDVSSLVYWNDPQGSRDVDYVSPFIGENLSVSF